MSRRYFHASDKNQAAIVKTLRKLGIRVHIANEEYDLVAQFSGLTMLCEVRPADKPRKARKGRQEKFQKEFMVYWLQTDQDCLNLYETFKRWHRVIQSNLEGR